jgi:Flp pilus assembly protein TadG
MFLKFHRSLDRVRRRFRKDDRGTTAVEFAFVGGPFLFLLLATFETGLNFLTEYSLQSATTTASRLIRTGQVQNGGISKEDFKAELCKNVPAYLDCDNKVYINVETRTDFTSAASRTNARDADGNLDENLDDKTAFQPGAAGQIVIVETFYVWDLFTPGISKLLDLHTPSPKPAFLANLGPDKRLITGVAVFQNEPFNDASGS